MKRFYVIVLFACVLFSSTASAATKTLTLADHLKNWLSSTSKDFKKIKTKDGLVTVPPYTDRMLDSLSVTGLQTNATVFPTLSADLQTALTRLKTDLQTVRTKNSDFQKLIDQVIKELRTVANGTTPPTITSAQTLFTVIYTGAGDGEFSDKDKQQITEALAAVVATPGLASASITSIQDAVNALLASGGVTAADIALLKNDLANIATIIKAL